MQVCLTADETNILSSKIGFFIPGFIPSVPRRQIPLPLRYPVEKFLFKKMDTKPQYNVVQAPLGLRRVEDALLNHGISCKVISPQKIGKLSEEVDVFGVSSMDPLGLGPVSATFRGLLNFDKNFEENKPFTELKFLELIKKIKQYEKPIVVGGSGAGQFELMPEKQASLGIDYVITGEAELIAPVVFKRIINQKHVPKIIRARRLQNPESQVPLLSKPTYQGIIEISRGCDRHCKFCDPAIRKFHWFSKNRIVIEAKRTALENNGYIRLLGEDILRYGNKIHDWIPCGKLIELIRDIKKIKTVSKIGLSHACLSSALANPKQIEMLREELDLSPDNFASLQVGIETGSVQKIKEYMPLKAAPFKPDDWHEVVLDGWKLLCKNYIYPAGTIIIGLDDSEEDLEDTIHLIQKVSRYPGMFFPLFFMSLGRLKNKKISYRTNWFSMPNKMRELYLISLKQLLRQTEHIDGLLFGREIHHRILNQILIVYFQGICEILEDQIKTNEIRNLTSSVKVEFRKTLYYLRDKIQSSIQSYGF